MIPGLVKRIPPSAGRSFYASMSVTFANSERSNSPDAIRPQGDERGIGRGRRRPGGRPRSRPACIRQWIEPLAHTQQHLDRATVVALLDLIVGDPDLQDTSVEIAAGAFIDNPGLFQ